MASGNRTNLAKLLLQQIDSHPIRALSVADLVEFGDVVADFRQLGLLRYRRQADEYDAISVEYTADGEVVLEAAEELPQRPGTEPPLRWLDVQFRRVALQIRRAAQLTGSPLEVLNERVVRLGQIGTGPRTRNVFLVRLLRDKNALDTVLAIKTRSGAGLTLVLTPTFQALSPDILRRIELEGVALAAVSELLDDTQGQPFALRLEEVGLPSQEVVPPDALEIDMQSGAVIFCGNSVSLEPRDYSVLVVLAREAEDGSAVASFEDLHDAIAEGKAEDKAPKKEQVTASVSRLRQHLGTAGGLDPKASKQLIINVRAKGYRLQVKHIRISGQRPRRS